MNHIKPFAQFINEANLIGSIAELRNRPTDTWNETLVKLVLDRKVTSNMAVYRLETDNWFRRWEGLGKGHGVMIRKIQISNNPVRIPNTWLVGPDQSVFKAIITYWPDPGGSNWSLEDDVPSNWETAYGYIILGNNAYTGFEMQQVFKPKALEQWINSNINTYQP